VQNDADPSGLFSLRVPQFESDQPGILNSPGVMLFGLPRRQRLPKSLWPASQLKRDQSLPRRFGQILESYRANSNGFWS
jgi:hypothetical protein